MLFVGCYGVGFVNFQNAFEKITLSFVGPNCREFVQKGKDWSFWLSFEGQLEKYDLVF